MSESFLSLLSCIYKDQKKGPDVIMQRQKSRLAEMVAFARSASPYYRDLYRDLPEKIEGPENLPVTSKKELMEHFNGWVTEQDVTYKKVCAFIDNPDLAGELFLGRYLVGTSSGTKGYPGFFLMDKRARSLYTALAGRRLSAILKAGDVVKVLHGGMRTAMLYITGGHFVAFAGVSRALRSRRVLTRMCKVFPVDMPLHELTDQLNRFRPVLLCGYAGTIALLAAEQEAGRLNINPVQVHLTAEKLSPGEYAYIAQVFNTRIHNWYGCAEFAELTHTCTHGHLHVNSDWVIFEPVNKDYQPVSPGQPSHTVLLSNLVNRIQPILRYDLGDSIQQDPDSCPCGNPFPVIKVCGRKPETFSFPAGNGEGGEITIMSLVFTSFGDRIPGIRLFQVVQTTPTNIRVRFRTEDGVDPDQVWNNIHKKIINLFIKHDLEHITVERAGEQPQQTDGGKYRTVIPFLQQEWSN